MTANPAPDLETQLNELTTWRGPAPELWRRALKSGAAQPVARRCTGLHRRDPTWLIVAPPRSAAGSIH